MVKTNYIQVRVSDREKELLQQLADHEHLNLSAYIRSTLLKKLKENGYHDDGENIIYRPEDGTRKPETR